MRKMAPRLCWSELLALVILMIGCASCTHVAPTTSTVDCDVVIAGGSTASLAAAITAAETFGANVTVCFVDMMDWSGGQLTTQGVSAVDFGELNRKPENMARSFAQLIAHFDGNPGACSVSTLCFVPRDLVEGWINPRLAQIERTSNNLRHFRRAVVTQTHRHSDGSSRSGWTITEPKVSNTVGSMDGTNNPVVSLTVVQRAPRPTYREYSRLLSQEIEDWYSPEDSAWFTKQVFQLRGRIFIEATELGDVLASGRLPFTQGVEVPDETSLKTDETCGQAWTTTYFLQLFNTSQPAQQFPQGSTEGTPWPDPESTKDWVFNWNYRRAHCAANRSLNAVNTGDVTQQNYHNDLFTAYPLLPQPTAQIPWRGGLNLTVLQMLENRTFAYFHFIRQTAPDQRWQERLGVNHNATGTVHGLSKFPYLRDTRRAVGLDGFRLEYWALNYLNSSNPQFGYRFNDTVALANYNDDIHALSSCKYPDYISQHETKPFYIPFRALTVDGAENILVAGKTMAQTFHANAATRLHPSEWSSGVAAGAIAAAMVVNGWNSTRRVLDHMDQIQALLNSSRVGQPLQWTTTNPPFPQQIGYLCALERCIGTDRNVSGHPVFPSMHCDSACQPLSPDEWVADGPQWQLLPDNRTISAIHATLLKKSIAQSAVLPDNEKKSVAAGTNCTLVNGSQQFQDYYLCHL